MNTSSKKLGEVTLALLLGAAMGLAFALGSVRLSPTLVTVAVAGLGLFLLLFREPVWGLYFLAAAVPIERLGRLTDDTAAFSVSLMRGIGMLAAVALLMHCFVRRRPVHVSLPLVLWTIYVVLAIASLTYTSDLLGGVKIASGAFGNILFLLVISNLVLADTYDATRRRANWAILIWLIASTAVALYSISDWHLGSGRIGGIPIDVVNPQAGAQTTEYRWSTVWEDTAELERLSGLSLRRSMGPTSHAAVFGINLLMSVPFFLYGLRLKLSRWMRSLLLVGLASTGYCLFLTNTRSVLLVAGATLALCVLWGLLPFRLWTMYLGIVAVGAALLIVPVDIFNRILDVGNYTSENSAAMRIRFDYWKAGLQAIGDHWIAGVGLGNQKVVLEYLRNPIEGRSHMHNIFLQTAMDIGVFGWMVFMGFLGTVLLWANRAGRILKRLNWMDDYWLMVATQILMITVLVYGLQVDVFYFPLKGWWLITGIVVALYAHLVKIGTPPAGPEPEKMGAASLSVVGTAHGE